MNRSISRTISLRTIFSRTLSLRSIFLGTFLLFASVSVLLPSLVHASHDSEEAAAILQQLEDNRRLIVAENMGLEDNGGDAFWGVYDVYRAEIAALDKQGFKLLREFRDHFEELTDERASNVISTYFDLEQQSLAVRQGYVAKFNEVLSSKQTLRFYQIENKLDAIIQADISSVTPLVPD
jgi:hypothetical protein